MNTRVVPQVCGKEQKSLTGSGNLTLDRVTHSLVTIPAELSRNLKLRYVE